MSAKNPEGGEEFFWLARIYTPAPICTIFWPALMTLLHYVYDLLNAVKLYMTYCCIIVNDLIHIVTLQFAWLALMAMLKILWSTPKCLLYYFMWPVPVALLYDCVYNLPIWLWYNLHLWISFNLHQFPYLYTTCSDVSQRFEEDDHCSNIVCGAASDCCFA